MRVIFLFLSMLLSSIAFSFKSGSTIKRVLMKKMMSSSSNNILKTTNVLVPVADGSEEIETSTIVDTLVRGGAVSLLPLK